MEDCYYTPLFLDLSKSPMLLIKAGFASADTLPLSGRLLNLRFCLLRMGPFCYSQNKSFPSSQLGNSSSMSIACLRSSVITYFLMLEGCDPSS
jgi:hypothetical protein